MTRPGLLSACEAYDLLAQRYTAVESDDLAILTTALIAGLADIAAAIRDLAGRQEPPPGMFPPVGRSPGGYP